MRTHAHGGFGFADLALRGGGPEREADHSANLHRRTRQLRGHQRNPVGIDTHTGEFVLPRLPANLHNFRSRRIRTKQRVIDEPGDSGVDPGQSIAGRHPVGAHGDNLFRFDGAGLRAALRAAGTHLVRDIQALCFGQCRAADPCEDFLADLRYELVEFRGIHFGSLAYFCSI